MIILKLFPLALLASSVIFAADGDYDGVEDKKDMCPKTNQLKKVDPNFRFAITVNEARLAKGPKAWPVMVNGCEPDDDSDGIINSLDYCPDDDVLAISKGVAQNGCPLHSDGDGTPDYRDECPGTLTGIATNEKGCPLGESGKQVVNEHVTERIKKLFK